MRRRDINSNTASYQTVSTEEAAAAGSNAVYQKPAVWEAMKQKWKEIIHREVSRYDTQIDERSGLIEAIEQNMQKLLHDDMERQEQQNAERLKGTDADRHSELERLKSRLDEVQRQKTELGAYLRKCEAERREKYS